MRLPRRLARFTVSATGALLALALFMWSPITASANVPITVVSLDPYTNTSSYHKTQVEPDTFSFGTTIVSAFQSGRFTDGGASNIGWATSTNSGATWTKGFLPGTTVYATPAGPYARDTDPAVAYDPKHNTWMIVSLPLNSSVTGVAVIANLSTDGGLNWGNPVKVQMASGFQDFDKTWVSCDTWSSSPNYGNCYAEWDDFGSGNVFHMARSTDGGLHWSASTIPGSSVIGGLPLAQPNGNVVVPIDDGFEGSVQSFMSTNGGISYTGPATVATIQSHGEAGNLRSGPLPSAEVDAAGKVYVVWSDCRFRSACSANDIVMSTSTNGQNWSAVVRIPIDPTSSTVDHFLPGLAVDRATSGNTAHLGLTYYYYPQSSCSQSTCQLDVGYVQSTDGGATWTAPVQVAGPFKNTWLPNTSQGYMVGDYNSTSFAGGKAYPVFAAAKQWTCTLGQITSCKVTMVAPKSGLFTGPGVFRAGLDHPVPGARSDHPLGGLKRSR
jgi:hypothetical protein